MPGSPGWQSGGEPAPHACLPGGDVRLLGNRRNRASGVPRPSRRAASARRSIVRFFVPYFALVYGVGLSVAASLRFAIIIPLIVVGYSVVTGLLFKWVVDLSRTPQANLRVNEARSGPDMLSVPCDPEAKAVILDARVDSHRAGLRDRPQVNLRRSHACKHQIISMRPCVGHGSRGRFPGFVRKEPRTAMRGMCLSKGTSSFPTEESATSKPTTSEFCGHFRIRGARLSRNRFQMTFGREPVKEIAVLFSTTDPVYAEVSRVLRIMIPEIDIS